VFYCVQRMNTKHSGRFVAYYRVSTARQGRSGLGLEAQRQAVGEHLNGGKWKLVAEFTEVESGKRSDRPRLAEALKACRLQGAKLIIAKLDRLARNVAFISNLMESKVQARPPHGSPSWRPSPNTRRR
jgi:DNA invertase Pin-like site-specific DNA recombinase